MAILFWFHDLLKWELLYCICSFTIYCTLVICYRLTILVRTNLVFVLDFYFFSSKPQIFSIRNNPISASQGDIINGKHNYVFWVVKIYSCSYFQFISVEKISFQLCKSILILSLHIIIVIFNGPFINTLHFVFFIQSHLYMRFQVNVFLVIFRRCLLMRKSSKQA